VTDCVNTGNTEVKHTMLQV